ncbi:MAG: SirB2 family protein, partial [Candidatus Dechloromonas phosphoritropha]
MSYLALKHLHVACVVLSGLGFALRGWWMLAGSPLLKARLAKVVPHVVDTTLLGSAVVMAWQS